jgi:hypothetical protein
MLPAFVAAEDDTGHLARGQFMDRSIHDRDLLASNAQFPAQVSGPPHWILLLFAHAQHLTQARFQHYVCRAFAASVQPVFKILNFDDMRNLGMADLDRSGGQSFSDVADPVMLAQRGEGLGDRFVERFSRHVEFVGGIVQIVDNNGASFKSYDGNLWYSLFVRL